MSWDARLFGRHLMTRRFGREFVWLDETDSTNRWLIEHAGRFAITGGVVAAGHQTHGRGRYERVWFDAPDASLLFSVLMRYPAADTGVGFISLMPAVALAEVLHARWGERVRVSVKWPNDVRLNGRKVAGILGQSVLQGDRVLAVVGMGVNVAIRAQDLPAELRAVATSVLAETGDSLSREALLAEILGKWELLFDLFLDGNYAELHQRWERFGPAKEAWMTRREGPEVLAGHYLGLGEHGQLLLRDEAGVTHEIFTGDIEW